MKTELGSQLDYKLPNLFQYQFGNLRILADDEETFNQLGDNIEQLIQAWHHAYARFLAHVWGVHNQSIPFKEFPEAGLIITRNKEVFRMFYHSPERWAMLPEWVRGYVNQSRGVQVQYYPEGEKPRENNLEGGAHEFIHLILPKLLGIPYEDIGEVWNTWINEAFAVGLNQRSPIEWLSAEMRRVDKKPTIQSILDKGIFAHDKRKPEENVAYQYCVHAAEQLGLTLIPVLRQTLDIPTTYKMTSFEAIMEITTQAYRNQRSLMEETAVLGVDLTEIQDRSYRALNLN